MSPTEKPTRIVSCGDIEFVDRLSAIPSVPTAPVQAALAYLKQADICFINCEMPLTRGGYRQQKFSALRSDPAIAEDLVALGAHVATIANNHMMDYSYPGLFDTLENLGSAGIAPVGAGRNVEEALKPHFRQAGGERFAFLGLACTLPPGSVADKDRPGIAPIRVSFSLEVDTTLCEENPGIAPLVHTWAQQPDVDRVAEAIAAAKRQADHVVVGIHWGITRRRITPLQGMICEYEPPLGRALIDAGADLVLGHHSHNLLGVEVYKGKPIFYSLGNFTFQPWRSYMEPESVIVLADFAGSSLRLRLVPILENADGFPEIPSAAERDRIAGLLKERSEQFGTRFLVDAEGIEVQLGD